MYRHAETHNTHGGDGMNEKVSKAQEEVWEWKDDVYNDIKGLSSRERIEFFRKRSEKLLEELGLEKIEQKEGVYKLKKKASGIVAEGETKYGGD